MSNKNKQLPAKPLTEEDKLDYKIQRANFTNNILVFLNYQNFVTCHDYELTIRGGFLFIYDTKKDYTMLVPLNNVSSMEVV